MKSYLMSDKTPSRVHISFVNVHTINKHLIVYDILIIDYWLIKSSLNNANN